MQKFICKHCNQSFSHKSTITRHINKKHKPVRLISCPYKNCVYTTPRNDVMYRHFVKHTNNKQDTPGNIFKKMERERGEREVLITEAVPFTDSAMDNTCIPVLTDFQFQSLLNNSSTPVSCATITPTEPGPPISQLRELGTTSTAQQISDTYPSDDEDIIEGADFFITPAQQPFQATQMGYHINPKSWIT